jgi:membrane protein required for colicin V production
MNWADIAILTIAGISALLGLMRGFIHEAISLSVWFLAVIVAMLFNDQLALLMNDTIETPSLRKLVASAALFLTTLVLGSLVGKLLGQLVQKAGLGSTDRLLGMLFGLARGGIICLVLLVLIPAVLDVTQDPWWHQSQLIPHVLRFEEWGTSTFSSLLAWFKNLAA